MTDLFGDLPEQHHPATLVAWCTYPSAEGVPPSADCLTWRKGLVKAPADCGVCLFCKPLPAPPTSGSARDD